LSKAKEDLKKYFSIIAAKVGDVLHGCTGDGAKDAIQQINRLLEPFILSECSVSLLSRFDRSMAQQMLNVCNGSTSAQ